QTIRQPACDQLDHLRSPLGQLLVRSAQLRIVTLGRTEYGQKGQPPDTTGPRDLNQQHTAQPAQAAGFDKVRMAGADRIAVDAFGLNLLTTSPFDGVIQTTDE